MTCMVVSQRARHRNHVACIMFDRAPHITSFGIFLLLFSIQPHILQYPQSTAEHSAHTNSSPSSNSSSSSSMSAVMAGSTLRVNTTPRRVTRRTAGSVRVQATARVDQFNKSDIIVSPSILSANFSKLGEQVGLSRCRNSLGNSSSYTEKCPHHQNRSRQLTRPVATGCTWTLWTAALCPTSPLAPSLWMPCAP